MSADPFTIRPLYTPFSCDRHAFQLDWSYSLFWNQLPVDFAWLADLQGQNERDGIRILQHRFSPPSLSQFLVSTRPATAPVKIAQRIKGRLQALIRAHSPRAFRRNYALRSIGSTRREKLERYLAVQLEHHAERGRNALRRVQFFDPQVDLALPQKTTHARYWYNLHLVLVHDERYRETRMDVLDRMLQRIRAAAAVKGHRLSRAAILPDHVHLLLGCSLNVSPESVVLGYMNNLAHCVGMLEVFRHSYFAGTFSEYDLGAIP